MQSHADKNYTTKNAAVIGWPVKHSLSPKLHNFWIKNYGIIGNYTAVPVEVDLFPKFISSLLKSDFVGVNITIPHKETAYNLIQIHDHTAMRVMAVNTAVVRENSIIGFNTDIEGFTESVKHNHPSMKHTESAVILGCGGAARSIIAACDDLGFVKKYIVARNIKRAENLVMQMKIKDAVIVNWNDRDRIIENADILVNTTPLGLKGYENLDINLDRLPLSACVADIVYGSEHTELLQRAKARGNSIVDGIDMLIYQAVPAFELFFGIRPITDDNTRYQLLK